MLLQIEGVSAFYGKLQALDQISITIQEGETTIMVGPNGAGKTTLLRTISGFLHPASGKILFNGEKIDDLDPYRIVEIGISQVPEGGRLFPYLSVKDNLRIGSFPKQARSGFKKSLGEVYELFPILRQRANQLAGTMSGGERQILAIARSLMAKPILVLLDEPSTGLAPLMVTHVINLANDIKKRGYSILMVEQNARKALEVADRAFLLESGRVQKEGNRQAFLGDNHIKRAYLGI
ncbi:MAG TPA: ABC transporter ATP-binding protein [Thermodesulfobacteriota bacterium]|nr:ABC transporter ATP-binding protein [Thermodesulfobacteriota bacterium]